MNKGNLAMRLLFLAGGVALTTVYKWMDESEMVHYGDSPPAESDVQSLSVPEGPTEEEIERARQRMQEKIKRNQVLCEGINPPERAEKPLQRGEVPLVTFDNVDCFSPLSETVHGSSARTDTPITATSLIKNSGSLRVDYLHWL